MRDFLMKSFVFAFIVCLSAQITFAQNESDIPFLQNTDGDTQVNILDNDDDNDGVLDNQDFFPLDPNKAMVPTATTTLNALMDAGLRGNTAGNSANNYGTDASIQTSNDKRAFILKFAIPSGFSITEAVLQFYTGTENDPLNVYFLPDNNWTENAITYGTTNFNGQVLLGNTSTPVGGVYSFNLLTTSLPATGGEITLLIYDQADPNGTVETLLTRESSGASPFISLQYEVISAPKLLENIVTNSTYLNGNPIEISYTLAQAPSAAVYVPFEISDPSVAQIVGSQYLVFDNTNWNLPQILTINPLAVGNFDVLQKPIHSTDNNFNGVNPADLSLFSITASTINNLSTFSASSGSLFTTTLLGQNATGGKVDYRIVEGPAGLNIVENTGLLSFNATSSQVGVHPVTIELRDENGNVSTFQTTITVTNGGNTAPLGVIVDFKAPVDPLADGTPDHPFNDLSTATDYAAANLIANVYIRGVEWDLPASETISTVALASNPITIQPFPGEHVKINFSQDFGLRFDTGSRYLTLQGIEIDGNTDSTNFWDIVSKAFWGDESIKRGGGLAIILDGQHINIRNNYIHDAYQKGVEIRDGRYVQVEGNIIHHIATTSLSGGHGVMRQQKGQEFFDNDLPGVYRWDIFGNAIFNVEQRIYSWVQSKGFIEMTLDEGKPILIDDPKDTDGVQEQMAARIKNNLVAFGSIDHIRLKSTPNLEVSQNSIYAESTHADGITDVGGDSNTPQFTNFIAQNNASQTAAGTVALEFDQAIDQTTNAGGTPNISGNIAMVGGVKPTAYSGITPLAGNQLFVDPLNGDFRINPALGLPSTLGVEPQILNEINARAAAFGVEIKKDDFPHDELKLTQTILDNIPGLNDGIAGNELVFSDYGTMSADFSEIDFDVVNATWKSETGSPNHQQFRLNETYVQWYTGINSAYKNALGTDYERIRLGSSYVCQSQVFDNDWLTVSSIDTDTNTVIVGPGQSFTLDGDLLIDFDGKIPQIGETFDLIEAATLTSANGSSIFDRVMFKGFTPADYSLTLVNKNGGMALRLSILGEQTPPPAPVCRCAVIQAVFKNK